MDDEVHLMAYRSFHSISCILSGTLLPKSSPEYRKLFPSSHIYSMESATMKPHSTLLQKRKQFLQVNIKKKLLAWIFNQIGGMSLSRKISFWRDKFLTNGKYFYIFLYLTPWMARQIPVRNNPLLLKSREK